jgi:hypothetical protein
MEDKARREDVEADLQVKKATQSILYPSPMKRLVSSLAFSHGKKLLHLPIRPCYSSVQKLPSMKTCLAVIPAPPLARGIGDH